METHKSLETLKHMLANDGSCDDISCQSCPLNNHNCKIEYRLELIKSMMATLFVELDIATSEDTVDTLSLEEQPVGNLDVPLEPVLKSGAKFDDEKPDMNLLLIPAMLDIGRVFTYGKNKYAAYNYRGLNAARLISAALRHLIAHNSGVDLDEETGEKHLTHAACSLIMALQTSIENRDGVKFSDNEPE